MNKIIEFYYPVVPEKWKPGSFQNRDYDITQTLEDVTSYHTGTDIDLPVGEPIFAIADGEVVYSIEKDDLGWTVVIRHELNDGSIYFSFYGHLKPQNPRRIVGDLVDGEWQKIKRGQLIGFIGSYEENGGYSPHLHFGIFKDEALKDINGNYQWAFGGYGKLKKDLNFKNPTLQQKLDIYRTITSQGGNAIDPVEFLEEHLICKTPWPKPIFKQDFGEKVIKSPGGNCYEWKEVETKFKIPANGKYIIKITASAKNGEQNGGTDDDDLRVEINNHDMRKGPWDGFNIASSWNGANLKGHEKEIYYIVNLDAIEENFFLWFDRKREQVIKFFADVTPTLKSIEVFPWNNDKNIDLDFLEKPAPNDVDRNGIPWKSFIFLSKPKKLKITTRCLSKSIKKGSDGDNIKILINGEPVQNLNVSPEADKYKNYYFSGDQSQGAVEEFILTDFLGSQDGVELWVDEMPFLEIVEIEF